MTQTLVQKETATQAMPASDRVTRSKSYEREVKGPSGNVIHERSVTVHEEKDQTTDEFHDVPGDDNEGHSTVAPDDRESHAGDGNDTDERKVAPSVARNLNFWQKIPAFILE